MFVEDFGVAIGGQGADLLGLFAQIDGARSQLQVEVDGLPFEIANLEFHVKSVRREVRRVNARALLKAGRDSGYPNTQRPSRRANAPLGSGAKPGRRARVTPKSSCARGDPAV